VANEAEPTPDSASLHTDKKRDRLSRDEVADAVLFMLSRPAGVNVDEMVLAPLEQIF
jgi:NADP-dependent 3-hydroxy acid dehydrogenase YdfG